MAESGGGDGNPPKKSEPREEKTRAVRERQAEERLRRLEELKKQALEAQFLREQKEAERRKRMDELRVKENERRSQVEGRKKQIWEAERERREAILRKNQEREARVDAKRRNERSSIVFAFGSSTPRLLETSDSMVASYWGPRRATSTANLRLFPATSTTTVAASATTRRPSERETDVKKRASSAGGLYRNSSDTMTTSMYEVLHWSSEPITPALKLSFPPTPSPTNPTLLSPTSRADGDDGWGVARVGRRKTDLMPTTPSPRDPTSRPGSGSRSLARTPGDVTPSRPGSVMSQSSVLSASTLNPRLRSAPRRPRPSSIHLTGVSKEKILSPSEEKPKPKENKVNKAPPIKPTVTKKQIQQKNEEIKKSQQNKDEANQSNADSNNLVEVNGKDPVKRGTDTKVKKKEPVKVNEKDSSSVDNREIAKRDSGKMVTPEKPVSEVDKENTKNEEKDLKIETVAPPEEQSVVIENKSEGQDDLLVDLSNGLADSCVPSSVGAVEQPPEEQLSIVAAPSLTPMNPTPAPQVTPAAPVPQPSVATATAPVANERTPAQSLTSDSDPTADILNKGNVMTRSRITTEEEAKAVLAERRRLAREQAEREAEAERQRLAKEAAEEEERLRKEEEEQRLAEEEQLRLIEEARKVEEQRLMLAIQEAQKREEEEKERRRLEEQARLEKEEAERLAREEAEKQRLETVERLKKEEEERQARRKRVEAIMMRTRNTAPSNANKAECEKGEEDGAEHEKDESKGNLEAFLHGERLSAERSLTNGQGSNKPTLSNMNEDSHPNGMPTSGIANEDCVNSNSPLATPLIAFQGKTKDTPLPTDFLA